MRLTVAEGSNGLVRTANEKRVMVAFADPVSNFINEHASLKILGLAFLMLVGTLLTAQAVGYVIPKGFVYTAMFFALGVQLIQMRYEANPKRRNAREVA